MKPYYVDESVTLYNADCRDISEWIHTDILVTDPPYGINWSQKVGSYKGAGSQTNVPTAVSGDNDANMRDEILEMWGPKPWIVFGNWRVPRPNGTAHRLIWHKAGMAPGPANSAFLLQDEEIYVSEGEWRRSSPPMRSVITTREIRSREVAIWGHPTPKPEGLMQLLIDRCPAGVIADPFAGTGTTLMAAKLQGRKAIGVEIDEQYCEKAAYRLSQEVMRFENEA